MKKGFTLVELLVVIAIIGILSSVVLSSLNRARDKGIDAAVQGQLHNIRVQAQIYHDDNNSYNLDLIEGDPADGPDCLLINNSIIDDPYVQGQLSAINGRFNATTTCYVSATSYAISASLKTGGDWCIDSTGIATTSTATANVSDAFCQ